MALHSLLAKHGLARLSLRRPEIRARLAEIEDPTGEFELLCTAYEEACQALDGWRRSKSDEAELRTTEYQQLVSELESDLIKCISRRLPRS